MDAQNQHGDYNNMVAGDLPLRNLPMHTSPGSMGFYYQEREMCFRRLLRGCCVFDLRHDYPERLALRHLADSDDLVYQNDYAEEADCCFHSLVGYFVRNLHPWRV